MVWVCVALIIFCVIMLVFTTKASRKGKKRIKSIKEKNGAIDCEVLPHVYGLDVAEGAHCVVCLCNNGFAFVKDAKEIRLSFDKVEDIDIKTNIEIQNSYVSSAGGAVGGAALFGPLGALIGGRVKKKKDKKNNPLFNIHL